MSDVALNDAPCDLDVWYPLLRGGSTCGHGALADGQSLAELGQTLAPGEATAVVGGDPGISIARAFATGQVHRLGSRIPTDFSYECFSAVPNTGGGFVLLASGDPAAFRAGLHLLPGGRLRWRVIKRFLDRAGALGLSRLPGATEIGLLSRDSTESCMTVPPELVGSIAAIACGVPGLHQKLTVSLLADRDQPARIVKISKGAASERQIDNEIRALTHVTARSGTRLAPRIVGGGQANGRHYLVQERLAGERSPDGLTEAHFRFLSDLQGLDAPSGGPGSLESFHADRQFVNRQPVGPWFVAMAGLSCSIEVSRCAAEVPCALAHGDFTPWNLVLQDGAMRAFDWEYSGCTVPLADLFHFVIQTGVLVERLSAPAIIDRVETILNGPARELIAAAGLDMNSAWACFGLYLLKVSVGVERQHQQVRPEFVQVGWLRDTRIALAMLVAQRLCARAGSSRRGVAA